MTEEDRQALIDWFKQRPEVESIRISGPLDAWYTDFRPDDQLTQVFVDSLRLSRQKALISAFSR